MTPRANARVAGTTFLLYIATGLTDLALFSRATRGAEGTAATLASIAQHATLVRVTVILALLQAAYALVLGVTLYALTRDQDHDIALLAMSFRFGEGVSNALSVVSTLALLSLATGATQAALSDAAASSIIGALLLRGGTGFGAIFFVVGSLLFSWLFLRARSIPSWLAWLGVVGSFLGVVLLPAQLAGFIGGIPIYVMWGALLVFEVTLAFWLIFKGVAVPVNAADS